MDNYKIRGLPLMKLKVDKGIFTYRANAGTPIWVPIVAWYIEGADKQILVDTGAQANFAQNFRGLTAEDINSFESALNVIGLKPEDINMVIQTHLHWDHCYNTARCTNAKVVVQKKELEFAQSPHPMMANLYHKPLFDNLDFMIIDGEMEILPGIKLVPVPGHTPGVQSVFINTVAGKAVISGFCAINDNFDPPEAIIKTCPVFAVGTHTNVMDAFDSTVKLKESADIIIAQHDPEFFTRLTIP